MLGCSIRKSPDQWLLAPTRSLSQLITSFIASQSLGIHRSLLFAFFILFVLLYKPKFVYTIFLLVPDFNMFPYIFKYFILYLQLSTINCQLSTKVFFTTLSLFLSICQRSLFQCIIDNV